MENRPAGGPLMLRSEPMASPKRCGLLLQQLLRPGILADPMLERHSARLAARFASYAACYPYGIWRRGLRLTPEMHRLTELYLPLGEIWPGWRALWGAALRVSPGVSQVEFCGLASWLAVLERLDQPLPMAPHLVLQLLAGDKQERERSLFAWQLPRHFGGGFGRYPAQLAWLNGWLTDQCRRRETISCLDAACGSGEGTYELAAALLRAGYAPERISVRGVTLQPLEVAAAAFAHFPHDAGRREEYRQWLARQLPRSVFPRIEFAREDLLAALPEGRRYNLILCNGLLGGPMLHGPQQAVEVIRGLAARLEPAGLLLAADCFHAGWRRRVPLAEIGQWFVAAGLRLQEVPAGIGGVRG